MKTSITITGQISGNRNLLLKLQTNNCEVYNLPFNDYELVYLSKKDAVQALSEARKSIKKEEPEFYNEGVSYIRGYLLNYDASYARIN